MKNAKKMKRVIAELQAAQKAMARAETLWMGMCDGSPRDAALWAFMKINTNRNESVQREVMTRLDPRLN